MNLATRIIVSRHPATLEYLAECLGNEMIDFTIEGDFALGRMRPDTHGDHGLASGTVVSSVPVFRGNVTPDDVRGKIVYGNIPLHLACLAERVYAVEFRGAPPRGAEFTLTDMVAAGVRLTSYTVKAID